jgi:hypothetical protein
MNPAQRVILYRSCFTIAALLGLWVAHNPINDCGKYGFKMTAHCAHEELELPRTYLSLSLGTGFLIGGLFIRAGSA